MKNNTFLAIPTYVFFSKFPIYTFEIFDMIYFKYSSKVLNKNLHTGIITYNYI